MATPIKNKNYDYVLLSIHTIYIQQCIDRKLVKQSPKFMYDIATLQ